MLYTLRNVISYTILGLFVITTNITAANQQQPPKQTTSTTTNSSANQVTPININTVDMATLQKINGMSKKKAEAIISYRTQNGPFKSLDDLLKVSCRGIHKKWLEKGSKFLAL